MSSSLGLMRGRGGQVWPLSDGAFQITRGLLNDSGMRVTCAEDGDLRLGDSAGSGTPDCHATIAPELIRQVAVRD